MKVLMNHYGGYTFDASAKTITFDTFRQPELPWLLLITNVTDNIVIYNFAEPNLGGSMSGMVLTLDYDTTSMSDTDELQIWVDGPLDAEPYLVKYNSSIRFMNDHVIPQKGSSVYFDTHAKVHTEKQTYDFDTVYTFASTDTVDHVAQVFRASVDNVHDVIISMKYVPTVAAETQLLSLDYANDTAAQADWDSSDSDDWEIHAETGIHQEGSGCLRLYADRNNAINDTCTYEWGTDQDWSGYAGLKFWFRMSTTHTGNSIRFEIVDDNSNYCYFDPGVLPAADTWYENSLNFDQFSGYLGVDFTKIRRIRCRCTDREFDYSVYFDNIRIIGSATDTLPVKVGLYDLGTSPELNPIGTEMTLDEGLTFDEANVGIYKEPHTFHIHAGSHDRSNTITVGNYYAIAVERPSTGSIVIYGSSTQYYTSGKMVEMTWNETNENYDTTYIADSMGFSILAHSLGRIREYSLIPNGDANGTKIFIYMVDAGTGESEVRAELEWVWGANPMTLSASNYNSDNVEYDNMNQYLAVLVVDDADSAVTAWHSALTFDYNPITPYG